MSKKNLTILPPTHLPNEKTIPWMMVSTGVSWQRLKDGQPDPDGKGPAGVYWSGDSGNFGTDVFVIEGDEPVVPIPINKDGYEEGFSGQSLEQSVRDSVKGATTARGATRLNAVMSDRNNNTIEMWDLYDGNEAMVWGVGDNHYYFRYELPKPNPVKWNRDPHNLPDYCGQGTHNCGEPIHDWEKIFPLFSDKLEAGGRVVNTVQAYKVVPDGIEPTNIPWTPIPPYIETGLTGTVQGEDPDWIAWTPRGTPQKVFRLPRIDLLAATDINESDTLVNGNRYSKKKSSATLYLTAQPESLIGGGKYYVPGDIRQWVWGYGEENEKIRVKNFLKPTEDGNPSTESFLSTQGGNWTLGETYKVAENAFEWTNKYGDSFGSRWTGNSGFKYGIDSRYSKDANGCIEHGIPRMTGVGTVFGDAAAKDVCGSLAPTGWLKIKGDMSGLWKKKKSSGASLVSDTVLLSSVKLTLNLAGHVGTYEVLLDTNGKPFSNVNLHNLQKLWKGGVAYSTKRNINIGPSIGIKEWNIVANMGYKFLFIQSDIFSPQLHYNVQRHVSDRGRAGDMPLCTKIELTYNNQVLYGH